jgi:phenylacetate-CoA ligase
MPHALTPRPDEYRQYFISTPLDKLLLDQQSINPEDHILALFHRCVAEVPGYRNFLEAQDINPSTITNFLSFCELHWSLQCAISGISCEWKMDY